jgi:ribonuclease D
MVIVSPDLVLAPATPSLSTVQPDLPPPHLVQTASELNAVVERLSRQPRIAVDTEADSLFAYYYKVCLIQISIPDDDYLIDPLALTDLSPLGEIFADPAIEKVFHAAENDVLLLKRDHRFHFAHLFDTMAAARILGWRNIGLAALLQEQLGVILDKRMQRTDWGHRPLTPAQLTYARLDAHYLLPLRDRLEAALRARGRWDEAQDAFAALPQIEYVEKPFDPDGFWRISGARELNGRQLAILRELYLCRERNAQRLDIPPFKVIGDQALLRLSAYPPQGPDGVRAVLNLPRQLRDRCALELWEAIQRGRLAPTPTPPARNHNGRPDEASQARYEALRAWRARVAAERAVEPDVILTNETLMHIARENPRTVYDLARLNHLSPWKLQTYGPALLAVLNDVKRGH